MSLLVLVAALHITATLVSMVGGSVALAALSATRRGVPVNRHRLLWGGLVAVLGVVLMARSAAQSDDVWGTLLLAAAAAGGAGALVLGLGPYVPWALKLPGRVHARLPRPLRAPARELAGPSARTAAWSAVAVLAVGVSLTMAFGWAISSAEDRLRARPGALVVDTPYIGDLDNVRRAVRIELPAVTPVVGHEAVDGRFTGNGQRLGTVHIGGKALLRYLTADLAFPYDSRTIVILSQEDDGSPFIELTYTEYGQPVRSFTLPAVTVRPPDPSTEGVFIPRGIAGGLGASLAPKQVIIDPSVHRVTPEEQERLDEALGEDRWSHVNRGSEPPIGWLIAGAVPALLALAAAVVAAGRRTGPRAPAAGRAWLAGTCSALLGLAAGTVMGLALLHPWHLRARGESSTAFAFPWVPAAALLIGLPLAAALVAGLLPRARPRTR